MRKPIAGDSKHQIARRNVPGFDRRRDGRVRKLWSRFDGLDFDLQLGHGVQARRGTADRALLANGQVQPRDSPQAPVEQVHAANFLFGGGAVGRAVHDTHQPHFREAGVEFFQHALHFANSDRIERQQGRHRGGVGGPGLAVSDRLFGQQLVDDARVADGVDQIELLTR